MYLVKGVIMNLCFALFRPFSEGSGPRNFAKRSAKNIAFERRSIVRYRPTGTRFVTKIRFAKTTFTKTTSNRLQHDHDYSYGGFVLSCPRVVPQCRVQS